MTVSKKDRHRNQLMAKIFASFIALVAAFVLGFIVRSQPAFVGALGFNVEGEPGMSTSSHTVKTTYDSVSARVSEVEDILTQGSLDAYELDAVTESLIQGLMDATGDPYATYLSPERYEAYVKESTANEYEGVGILFAEYNGRAYVADVFEGSEAETKGVKQGDFVQAIDGKTNKEWTLSEVLSALGSQEDDSVFITWLRTSSMDAETGEEFTTTLNLNVYEKANLDVQLDGEVGYMRLRQLSTNSAEMVQASLIDLADQGATSFILDLRGNPGGYLTQADDIASFFVKSGMVVQVETIEGLTSKTASGVTITDAPLVVMVDSFTAAAAEVLAASLQDNQRAVIVGETTMGKGAVQLLRELSFGGAVRYTAALYLTPLGHDIDGVGVIPNVKAEGEEAQMLLAFETIKSLA